MEAIDDVIASLKTTLLTDLDMGGLHSRNPTAHKWKAPYRSLQLREVVYWRMLDLLDQSLLLHRYGHALGARILLRSALETLAMLIYVNQLMAKVIEGRVTFHDFSKKTEMLLLGSRNRSTSIESVNILSVLDSCDKRYPDIKRMYDDLSESAHPNYEGMSLGYAVINREADSVTFTNRWMQMHGQTLPDRLMECVKILDHEYNEVWPEHFEKLEKWIEENEAMLEATIPAPPEGAA